MLLLNVFLLVKVVFCSVEERKVALLTRAKRTLDTLLALYSPSLDSQKKSAQKMSPKPHENKEISGQGNLSPQQRITRKRSQSSSPSHLPHKRAKECESPCSSTERSSIREMSFPPASTSALSTSAKPVSSSQISTNKTIHSTIRLSMFQKYLEIMRDLFKNLKLHAKTDQYHQAYNPFLDQLDTFLEHQVFEYFLQSGLIVSIRSLPSVERSFYRSKFDSVDKSEDGCDNSSDKFLNLANRPVFKLLAHFLDSATLAHLRLLVSTPTVRKYLFGLCSESGAEINSENETEQEPNSSQVRSHKNDPLSEPHSHHNLPHPKQKQSKKVQITWHGLPISRVLLRCLDFTPKLVTNHLNFERLKKVAKLSCLEALYHSVIRDRKYNEKYTEMSDNKCDESTQIPTQQIELFDIFRCDLTSTAHLNPSISSLIRSSARSHFDLLSQSNSNYTSINFDFLLSNFARSNDTFTLKPKVCAAVRRPSPIVIVRNDLSFDYSYNDIDSVNDSSYDNIDAVNDSSYDGSSHRNTNLTVTTVFVIKGVTYRVCGWLRAVDKDKNRSQIKGGGQVATQYTAQAVGAITQRFDLVSYDTFAYTSKTMSTHHKSHYPIYYPSYYPTYPIDIDLHTFNIAYLYLERVNEQ